MGHRRFVLFGIGGVIALVIALTAASLDDNLTYYLYPTEAVAQRADFSDGTRFRLAGTVVPGSVEESGGEIRFDVTDGGAVVPVILTGAPPPLFDENVPVLLEGTWTGEVFTSDLALIRHDENYEEAPPEGGADAEG
jgi:cytochrome c-type biogenesis protein CcmE